MLRHNVVSDSSKSTSKQGDKIYSNKGEMNNKGRDIVEKKISRFIEQGFL